MQHTHTHIRVEDERPVAYSCYQPVVVFRRRKNYSHLVAIAVCSCATNTENEDDDGLSLWFRYGFAPKNCQFILPIKFYLLFQRFLSDSVSGSGFVSHSLTLYIYNFSFSFVLFVGIRKVAVLMRYVHVCAVLWAMISLSHNMNMCCWSVVVVVVCVRVFALPSSHATSSYRKNTYNRHEYRYGVLRENVQWATRQPKPWSWMLCMYDLCGVKASVRGWHLHAVPCSATRKHYIEFSRLWTSANE